MINKDVERNIYIGIGASAGGLEAISTFFKQMPVDSGLTFIVIQHLSPDYKSMMVELLGKVTDIPVEVVKDGVKALPDHIYLIPPSNNMTIFHGKLLLASQDRTTSVVNLPIDLFLNSLAEDQGHNAIGIILSGTGSDGTRGCRAIKESGGLVMAQSENSAKFAGMPQSIISNGLADFVLSAEDLPDQLLKFVKHPMAPQSVEHEPLSGEKGALAKIFALLRNKTKIDFTFYKPPTITRRIERRISITQANSLEDYVDYLTQHPQEVTTLYRELLIGVTHFYRDEEVFDALRNEHLLQYIQNMNHSDMRVWVAGCSTGEEAYTYCMLIQEMAEECGKTVDLKLFATDIDQEALNKASIGMYSESIAADLPPRLLNKYFVRKDDQYQIARSLREMVVFARHDLIKDPPFTNLDLVSCRNLLIYLQPVLQQRIFDSFNFSLKHSALLVLGSSESLGEAESYFEPLDHRGKIYASRGNRKSLLTSERFRTPDAINSPMNEWTQRGRPTARAEYADDARILEAFIDTMTGEFLPSCMIVNESFELIRVMGDSSRFLRTLSGKVTADVTRNLVKELSVPVATGLAKVFKSRTPVSFTNVYLHRDGLSSKVNVIVKPMEVRRNAPLLAAVVISEATPPKEFSGQEGVKYDVDAQTMERLTDLEQELQFTRESLQATIEEMETSNEELQATNEELLASNEELQSTNEELQSVNEELFTVNAEYQGKISELSELNADLENFMAASKLVAVFLDVNLNIRRFTQNAKNLFNIIDHDIGRPLSHISHRLRGADLLESASQVTENGKPVNLQVKADSGIWYRLEILPFMLSHDVQGGVMIVLHSIHNLIAAQDDLQRARRREQLAQTLTHTGTWELDVAANTMVWSDNAEGLLGLSNSALGPSLPAFLKHVHPEDQLAVQAFFVDESHVKGEYYTHEFRTVCQNKLVRPMKLRCAISEDVNGVATHLTGVLHEVK